MSSTTDITIIGAGISGLLTAREFCHAGATVTLFDKQQAGKESSWAGGGILLPLYPWRQSRAITQLTLQSLKLYPQLSQQLINHTNISPELINSGLLIPKNPDIELAVTWCKQYNIDYQVAVNQQFERFNSILENPLWLPSIQQARNPRLLKSLKQELVQNGVQFIEGSQLTALQIQQREIHQIITTSGNYPVKQLILTTGAWSGKLSEQLFPQTVLDIKPVKGQMCLFDAPVGLLKPMILDGDKYLIPRADGKILVGSTIENQGFDKQTTDDARHQLQAFATHLLPELKNYPIIHHWAGLRPATQQGIPYIACHPDFDNLAINAGHFRNGLAMGPASAQLLFELITGKSTTLDATPYQLTATH